MPLSTKTILVNILVLSTVTFLASEIDCHQTQSQLDLIRRRDPKAYSNYEVLDPEGRFILEWVVLWNQQRIVFNVTVETRGQLLFGLSSSKGKVAGADIVIGGVHRDGSPYLTDGYGGEGGEVLVDPSQDWQLHSAKENDSHTFLIFSRPFDTCDEWDHPINEHNVIHLLWGYGPLDNPSQLDLSNWGNYPVYLLDPNTVPRRIKQNSFVPGPPPKELLALEGLQLWTVTSRRRLTGHDTEYHCTMHRGPRLHKKHHIVGFHARLDTQLALKHTHHVNVYRCVPPPGSNSTPAQYFHRFLGHPGSSCYFLARPSGPIPTQYCTQVTTAQAIGGRIIFYPDHIGFPLEGTGMDEYYLLQVHHDNPDRDPTIEFDVSVDIYYTDQLRPTDAGMMTIGHHAPGSPSILLPPQTPSHNIFGHCGGDCTRTMLPPEGIKVSFLVLHTHYSGRKVRVRHFRGGRELPWISADNNYENSFQAYRLLNEEAHILPEDHLTIQCEFDTTWTNGSVVGGFTTRQEMCLIYIFYHSRIPDYSLCRSEIVTPRYMRHYLGVDNITWSNDQIDFVATSPPRLAGMSMSSISDWEMEWTRELRSELAHDHRSFPQINTCSGSPFSSTGQGQVGGEGAVGPEQTHVVMLPELIEKYVPETRGSCTDWNS